LAKNVHVRKGDTVYVLSGKDSGKKGKVLSVNSDDMMVLIEGVNMSTKHRKPKSRYQSGGIIHQESPISSSKVMLVCDKCKAPTKIKKEVHADGQKDRVCKKCGELIDILKESKED
jgi:large subunit ribosomal protein L24